MDWRWGSIFRATALQVESPEFKPSTHQIKDKPTKLLEENIGESFMILDLTMSS
jgi:hypothetical protein